MVQSIFFVTSSSAKILLSQRAFRRIVLLLGLWLVVSTSYLYRQELAIKFGLWDTFLINAVNYSQFVDSRDSEQTFNDHLLLTQQGRRSGALFVGPYTMYSRHMLPLDSQKKYQMSLDLMAVSDGTADRGSVIYAGVVFFDEEKNIILEPQALMAGVAQNVHALRSMGRFTLHGVFSPTELGLARIPANASYMKIAISLNYADPRAAVILSNIKFTTLPSIMAGEKK